MIRHIPVGRSSQRGMSFITLVLLAALIISVFVVGAQVVPTGIEYVAAKRAIDRAKTGNTVAEIQQAEKHQPAE